jgi:hypothetical protein
MRKGNIMTFKSSIVVSLKMSVTLLGLAVFASSANATLITSSGGMSAIDGTLTFDGPPVNYFGTGPIQVGVGVGENITWLSTNSSFQGGSVCNYSGGYGFVVNGFWSGKSMIGLNSYNNGDVMTIAFNDGPVKEVGGFLNYATLGFGDAFIAAYDSSNNLLESYNLSQDAPISTPNGFNDGAFRGIVRDCDDIKYFTMSGAYIGADDVVFHRGGQICDVPEPGAIATGVVMLGSLAFGMTRRRFRRQSA